MCFIISVISVVLVEDWACFQFSTIDLCVKRVMDIYKSCLSGSVAMGSGGTWCVNVVDQGIAVCCT